MRLAKGTSLFVLLVFVLLAFLFLLLPRFLKIESIVCRSQYGICSKFLLGSFGALEGKNFKEARAKVKEILENDYSVSEFSLRFKLPNKLEVFLIEEKAEFGVSGESREMFALVGREGKVIRIEKVSNLPILEIVGAIPNVGEKVSQEILFASRLLSQMFTTYQIKEGKLGSNGVEFSFGQGKKVIFPPEGDVEVLMGSLKVISERIAEEKYTMIDLRFKNPVLK